MNEATPGDRTPDPAGRKFRFKPRVFTADNVPVSTPSAHGPTDVRDHFRVASAGHPTLTPSSAAPRENEVHGILRDNIAHAQAAGLNDVKPVERRRSRRLRDYLIVTIAANLVIGGVAWRFRDAPIVLVFVLAGFILFNVRFTWSVWVVMDDY